MQVRDRDIEEETAGPFTIERAWQAVRRRASLVVLIASMIIACGAVLAFILPTRYEATATVQIDPRKSNIASINGPTGPMGDVGIVPSSSADSEIEIVASRSTILRTIDQLNLRSDPEFTEGGLLRRFLRSILGSPKRKSGEAAASADRNDDPIGRILAGEVPKAEAFEADELAITVSDRLTVTRVRLTPLLEIRFSSSDPAKSARIANGIASAYLAGQIEEKRRAALQVSGLFENQIDEAKARVAAAERRVEDYKTQNNIFGSETSGSLTERQLSSHLERQVSARNATAEAKAKFEQARKIVLSGDNIGNLGDVMSDTSIASLKEQFSTAARRRAELESRYGPKHPDLQKARVDYDKTLALLNDELRRYVAKLKNDYEVAAESERQLSEAMSTFKIQQTSVQQASVKLKELEREAQTEKQIFESLLARYKQTAESQNLQLPDSRIVEMAEAPLHPSSPKRFKILILAIIAGFGAGIGLALALEFLNNGISRPEDVEHSLDLAHLSSLPAIEKAAGPSRDLARPARLVLTDPHSVFAEAIRGIRREVDQRRADHLPRIILVASGLPGEGSDLIASNLAHHYAMTGNSILLVDGDLRRWNLTRRLMTPQSHGLLEVLTSGLPVDQAILRDTVTGLHFLAATGSMPLDASSPELLVSQRMTAAIEQLKDRFDTIVVDAPPLLPVVDGRILADYADQIVYVTNWRRTPTQLSKRAIKSLGVNQNKIAGVVVNEVDPAVLEDAAGYAPGPSVRTAA
jgi:capsular exopolysaccharide synthesis family protein